MCAEVCSCVQVVTLAVYLYFAILLFGAQFWEHSIDIYVPVTAIIQYLFYFGWLRVRSCSCSCSCLPYLYH